MRRLANRTAWVCMAVVVCAAAAGVALTVGATDGTTRTPMSLSHAAPGRAATVPTDLAASYRVLGPSSTALPRGLASDLSLAEQDYGSTPHSVAWRARSAPNIYG